MKLKVPGAILPFGCAILSTKAITVRGGWYNPPPPPLRRTRVKRRFNYKKADWNGFTDELEQNVKTIPPEAVNYNSFAEMVKKSARRHIPRGCRVEYIPGLSDEIAEEYQEYVAMFEADPFSEETSTKGKSVMEHISQERRKTWHALIESTDMSKNSKKAWSTIGKLRGDPKAAPCQPKVTANQVAHQLLSMAEATGKSEREPNSIVGSTAKTQDLQHLLTWKSWKKVSLS